VNDETARRYYDNYEWFDRFFEDLHDLVRGEIGEALKSVGYDDDWPGFTKVRDCPTMPRYFQVAFYSKKGRPGLQVTALLGRKWDNRKVPSEEPHLMVLVHDQQGNDTEITPRVLDATGNDAFDPDGNGKHFKGKLQLHGLLNFYCFFVPLDAFSKQNCADVDATVREKIVEPLRAILDEYFSEPSKKPKR
jgi:hypothetical protein